MTDQTKNAFSAQDVFDPDSLYNGLRLCFQEELKLRGLLYELKAEEEVPRGKLAARSKSGRESPIHLVLHSGQPEQPLTASVQLTLRRVNSSKRVLQLNCTITDKSQCPALGTPLQAFFLTAGMLERLCGADATKSPANIQAALLDSFAGKGEKGAHEIARILSAAAGLAGSTLSQGECDFPSFELPRQAADLSHLPVGLAVVIVIDREEQESSR